MFMTVDCPDELFADAVVPAVMTGTGVRLEAVEDVAAGPWLAALIDLVDPRVLSDWDMPAYLRACARMQAWAAARLSEGIAELASRPEGFGADKEVAIALREPVGAAQRRIHHSRRLRRMLRRRGSCSDRVRSARSRRTPLSRRPAASWIPIWPLLSRT